MQIARKKKLVGRQSVDFAHCRWPANGPSNAALSSVGIFDLVDFPTNASLYFYRSSNKFDSTSGGGGSKWNDALSINQILCRRKGFLPWSISNYCFLTLFTI